MDIRKLALAAFCLLIAAPAYADPVSGYVNPDGTPAIPSALYTVTHPKTGHYIITFTTPMFPRANCVVVSVSEREALGAFVHRLKENRTACSFSFRLIENRHVPADIAFSFIAVPMSN